MGFGLGDVLDELTKHEALVRRCELASGEVIPESIRTATLVKYAPKEIRDYLQMHARTLAPNYENCKAAVKEYLLARRAWDISSTLPSAVSQSWTGAAPMDVGYVGGGKHKGDKGSGKKGKECGFCHKRGHTEDECWTKQRKGKGGKHDVIPTHLKGKGFDKNLKCDYCGTPGHESAKCWAKKRAEKGHKGGGVSAVSQGEPAEQPQRPQKPPKKKNANGESVEAAIYEGSSSEECFLRALTMFRS